MTDAASYLESVFSVFHTATAVRYSSLRYSRSWLLISIPCKQVTSPARAATSLNFAFARFLTGANSFVPLAHTSIGLIMLVLLMHIIFMMNE